MTRQPTRVLPHNVRAAKKLDDGPANQNPQKHPHYRQHVRAPRPHANLGSRPRARRISAVSKSFCFFRGPCVE
eukprot:4930947-Pyramimonas_sp.AAC.1